MPDPSKIIVKLINEDLWKKYGENNEMFVVRKGRGLLPTLGFTIENLEPSSIYTLGVRIVPMDNYRYRYENGSWMKQSYITKPDPVRCVIHSDGFKSGQKWMEDEIHFHSLKISNDRSSVNSKMIIIQPNQKYIPCLDIYQLSSDQKLVDKINIFRFESTKFIGVSNYKDQRVIELKKRTYKRVSAAATAKKKKKLSESSIKCCSDVLDSANVEDSFLTPMIRPSTPRTQNFYNMPDIFPAPVPASDDYNDSNSVPSDSFEIPVTCQDPSFENVPHSQNHYFSGYDVPCLVSPNDPCHAFNFFKPMSPTDNNQSPFFDNFENVAPSLPQSPFSADSHGSAKPQYSTIQTPTHPNPYSQSYNFEDIPYPPF